VNDMWQLILKADYDYVYEPKQAWLGVFMPEDDKILVNLSAITKKIRTAGGKEGGAGKRDRPYGKDSKIDRRTERDLTSSIMETLNHESIHAAADEAVNEVIVEIAEEIFTDLSEQQAQGNLPKGAYIQLDNIKSLAKDINYMLLQEYAVRLIEGKSPKDIITDLTGYITNGELERKASFNQWMSEQMGSGETLDHDEIKAVMQQVSKTILGQKDWLMRKIMNVAQLVDGTLNTMILELDTQDMLGPVLRPRFDFWNESRMGSGEDE